MRQDGLLDGVKVVECAGRSSMRFAAMLLAELGAEVVRVDSSDDRDDTHPLASELAVEAAWDHRKRHADVVELEDLLARADVVLTSARTGADGAFERSLQGHCFDGIHVLATPFGASGPYRRTRLMT